MARRGAEGSAKGDKTLKLDRTAIAAIIIAVCAMALFGLYVVRTYNTYGYSYDMGLSVYDLYYHVHYLDPSHILQYLTFGQHLEPDQLAIIPLFTLFPSAITLGLLQEIVISLTGLLVFFVARDLLKNGRIALLLMVAFLVNPGVGGLVIYDFHAEFLILPFFILVFYTYMKRMPKAFFASLLLLLGVMDSVPPIVIALGIALFAYALFYTKERAARREQLIWASWIILLALFAMALYTLASISLYISYQSVNSGVPILLRVAGVAPKLLSIVGSPLNLNVGYSTFHPKPATAQRLLPGFILAALIVFLSFGPLTKRGIILNFIMVAPWLVGGLALGDIAFFSTRAMYFSYAIGGAVIAAIISQKELLGQRTTTKRKVLGLVSICFIIAISVPIFVISFALSLHGGTPQMSGYYKNLTFVANSIPQNSSVVEPKYLFPRYFQSKNIWLSPQQNYTYSIFSNVPNFKIEYAITDTSTGITLNNSAINGSPEDYTIYLKRGTVAIYRLNSTLNR